MKTPLEILNKPDKLSKDEPESMKDRAPIVSFEDHLLEEPQLAAMWERDGRGEHPRAVIEALDPEALDIDPPKFM